MKFRPWQKLAMASAVVIALGVTINVVRNSNSEVETRRAFGELESQLNDVKQVKILGKNSRVTLNLVDKQWRVMEKSNYFADSGLLRKELLGLAQLNLLEAKTKKQENYVQLGVQGADKAGSDSIEVRVFGANGTPLAQLIVGKASSNGAYVRIVDDAQSWLASARPNFSLKPEDWLEKEILNLDTQGLETVSVTAVTGPAYALSRQTGKADFVLNDIPKGRSVKTSELQRVTGALKNLRLEDVVPAAEAPSGKTRQSIIYQMTDGLVIEASTFKSDGNYYLTVGARYKSPAIPATTSPPAGAGQAEAEQLQAKLLGWVYRIPSYQGEALMLTRDALLEPKAAGK